MNVTDEYGMNPLIAKCPSCQSESLFCGKIQTKIKKMVNKEVLFCKKCKLITPVEEFKSMLASR
jgi:transcription elongation factor Elf1